MCVVFGQSLSRQILLNRYVYIDKNIRKERKRKEKKKKRNENSKGKGKEGAFVSSVSPLDCTAILRPDLHGGGICADKLPPISWNVIVHAQLERL
eukprot:COSAG06_NODE_3413_length_5380_cov_4.609354_2_plen_95_part_00